MELKTITHTDYTKKSEAIISAFRQLEEEFQNQSISEAVYTLECDALQLEQNKLLTEYALQPSEIQELDDSIRIKISDPSLINLYNYSTAIRYSMLSSIVAEGIQTFDINNRANMKVVISETHINNEVNSFLSRYKPETPQNSCFI